jgi:hypothetical protein
MSEPRIVCHFSCGAASAVATKLTIAKYGHGRVVIHNAFIQQEDDDNRRFLADCEAWFEHPITVVQSEKYHASTQEVWEKKRYMNGPHGAPCSGELKRKPLAAIALPGDIDVIGYTAEEYDRFQEMLIAIPDRLIEAPLIEANLIKSDCLAIIDRAGIQLPRMYRLGFHNANCIGCPKGGEGYWNKIRDVFPEQFVQISANQESIGPGAYFFRDRKSGVRYGLKDLPVGKGNYPTEKAISCSFFCDMAEQDIAGAA